MAKTTTVEGISKGILAEPCLFSFPQKLYLCFSFKSDASLKTQQSEMEKTSKELLDTKALIHELQKEASDKDNVIIELYGLKEKDEENFKSRVDELNQQLQEKIRMLNQSNEELQEKKGAFDQLHSEFGSVKGELEKYKSNVKHLEENLEESRRANATEVERLKLTHEEEVQSLNSKHVAELENLKLLMKEQVESKGEEGDSARQQQVNKLTEVYESEVNALKESLNKQIELNNEFELQMSKMKDGFEENVARLTTEKGTVIEAMKVQFKELETSSTNEIRELRSDLKKKDRQIAELEDNLSSFEEEHSSDVAQYEQNLQKQQEQTAELEKQLVLELGSESARHEKKLAETKAQLEAQYKGVFQELLDRVKELESENETLQGTHAQEIEVFKENFAQYTNRIEDQMRELQSEAKAVHERELEALRTDHQEALRTKEEELRALCEGKKALESELTMRGLSEETSEHSNGHKSQEITRLRDEYEGRIQTLKENVQNERERLEKEVAEAADAKEKEFMAVVEEILQKHQVQLSEVKNHYEQLLTQQTGKSCDSLPRKLIQLRLKLVYKNCKAGYPNFVKKANSEGTNECDHRILVLLKQQRERPEFFSRAFLVAA